MQWGISLNIKSDFDSERWGLPPPSKTRWLSKMDGTKTLQVLYHFQYAPQSWREWQRVASIKVQIQGLIPHAEFSEYMLFDEVERVYTIAEMGKYFTKFVKYQKPLYPSCKNEFMSSLTIYAMRLHYESMLHFEAVIAMALHFNSTCGLDYSFRELNRKARAIFELDRSTWKVKLSDAELKKAHKRGNEISSQKMRDKSKSSRDEAIKLKADGKTLNAISQILNVSPSTVRRYVSKQYGCSHIDNSK